MEWLNLKNISIAVGLATVIGGLVVNILFTWFSWQSHIQNADEFHRSQVEFNKAQIELNTALRIEQEVRSRLEEERHDK